MKLTDFLGKVLGTATYNKSNSETIYLEIDPSLYLKHMAVYTAAGLIANAVSQCEFTTFENFEEVKNEDYYRLNVSPNPNQTATQFWQKVVLKMIASSDTPGEALVVETRQGLFCADFFGITEKRAIKGNIFSNVAVEEFSFAKNFKSSDVMLFKMTDKPIINLINSMYSEYGKVFESASKAFNRGNGRKYKIKVAGTEAGDEEFNKYYKEFLEKQLKSYIQNDDAIYPEFDGYELIPETDQGERGNAEEIIKIRKDVFEMVYGIYHIPLSFIDGSSKDMDNVMDEFLTFAVDPICVMIKEVLNKYAGMENYLNGNYYHVDSSGIYHRDLFRVAASANSLYSASIVNVDEIREKIGLQPLNTEWSKRYVLTKNYQYVEDAMKGGETSEKKDVLSNSE